MNWQSEIDELHAFFQAYFLGQTDSLDRADAALADDFVIVSPDGRESDRAATMAALLAGHGHTESLVISTTSHELISESGDLVVASYVESHALSTRSTHRKSTVVFVVDDARPNGLAWLRVHETWIDRL